MKYHLHINQPQALELGITNINQAHIFDLLTTCPFWTDEEVIDGKVYYFTARQRIVSELELLNLKPDTVYRHLKSLADLGLIEYIKSGKKDCIKITRKGKKYHSKTISEINPNYGDDSMSDSNPKKVGNKSEKYSEINPTYTTTIHYPTTILSLLEKEGSVKAFIIVKFYREFISSLESKTKEIKSVNALKFKENELENVLTGLFHYSQDLPQDPTKIKNLHNFIQDNVYKDYQEPKKLNPSNNTFAIADKKYNNDEEF